MLVGRLETNIANGVEKMTDLSKRIALEVAEELYYLNADISLLYVAKRRKPTFENIVEINRRIGECIKKLRTVKV